MKRRKIIKFPDGILKHVSQLITNYRTSSQIAELLKIAGYPALSQSGGINHPSGLYKILKIINDEPSGNIRVIAFIQTFCNPTQWIGKEPIRRDVMNMLNGVLFAVNLQLQEDGTIKNTLEKISHSTNVDLPGFTLEPKLMEVNPVFKARNVIRTEGLCFVLMPFKPSFNRLYRDKIKPTVEACGFKCLRADDLFSPTPILEDIWVQICKSKVILADVTGRNPNVFYEIGIAHTVGKPVIIITQDKADIPFDVSQFRYFLYSDDAAGRDTLCDNITSALGSIIKEV